MSLVRIHRTLGFDERFQKVKSNQEECWVLETRVLEILYMIVDAVQPDPTQLPPDLLVRIEDFTRYVGGREVAHRHTTDTILFRTLEDIKVFMESLRRRKALTRLIRHKEDEGRLIELNQKLDDVFKSFTVSSLPSLLKNTLIDSPY
jgi:hypothetical protein